MLFKDKLVCLLISGCFLFACSKTRQPLPDVVEPPIWFPNSLNDVRKLHIVPSLGFLTPGSTQYVSKLNFNNWFSEPPLTPFLGEVIDEKEVINLITIGGGLTAGAQGGGLFRDGQLAAYPNLVAKQMGMMNFKTPLFDEVHANGTGFTLTNPDNSQSFFKVINNLGTIQEEENGKPLTFSPYVGQVNNYATPWLSTFHIFNSTWEAKYIGNAVNANGVSWPQFLPYAARFIPIEHFATGTMFIYIADHQPYNFFILEDAAENFLNLLRLKGDRIIGLTDLIWDLQEGDDLTLKAIQRFKRNGSNGVVFTVPHYKYLGISTWNIYVLNEDEIAVYERAADIVNEHIVDWAKENGVALVDLNELYKKVADGQLAIGKDIHVSGKFDGNFFSSDGIYPSVIGQAFVANEVIKAINLQYNSKVQPLNIEKYLISIGIIY